jgi:hypothetical protein
LPFQFGGAIILPLYSVVADFDRTKQRPQS